VEQLAGQLAKSVPEGRQWRLAVTDFPDLEGVMSNLGRHIAERLTTRLSQNAKLFVIERRRLGQVLAELKFSMSDLVDPNKAKQLGRMLGVEALVVGSVSDLGNVVDVDARIIEIETNRMMPGALTTISKDQVVDNLIKGGRSAGGKQDPGVAVVTETPPPVPLKGFRYSHKFFTMELTNVEVVGDEVKLTLVYTNRTDSRHQGNTWQTDINKTYLIDNLGNRYKYTGDSFNRSRSFPAQIAEQIWITFGQLRPGASTVNLVLDWLTYTDPQAHVDVVIRGIPLRR
jgi:TolB-like protein